ncbi:hypothetical protein PT974_03468 [Cladobotryum mycophilum]|uniref:Uncharacterized protein n=1 Tax=Cladobotryum mycophilum TaxID=491253 RepID=A0ABR0STJ2_9HYPO
MREASAESAKQQELYFLNVTGSLGLDEDARTTIRSQSLKDYHRKRKIQRTVPVRLQGFAAHTDAASTGICSKGSASAFNRSGDRSAAPAGKSREKGDGHEDVQIRIYQRPSAPLQVNIEISGGDFDPFNALPLPSTPRIQLLIKQLMVRINSNSPTRDYRRYWFKHASHDLACFYIALSQSASDAGLVLQKGCSAEAVMYLNKALHLVNQRLDDPVWRVRNTTIGAVAALASYEISNGSLGAARTHLLGLETMVRMRGGINHPSISNGLRRIVLWVDLVAASHEISVPRISTYQVEELIVDINGDLQILTAAKVARKFATATPDEEIVFGEKAYLVQKRLIEIAGTSISSVPATWTLDTVWALAATMYSNTILFETSIDSLILETLVMRIQQCMETLIEKDGLDAVAKAVKTDSKLLWALVLGGIVSENMSQRKWFIQSIREICRLLDPWLQGAFPARQALAADALWDSSLDDFAHRLWAEVGH